MPSPRIWSQSEDAESIRIRYENQINQGITNALLSILSDQQFAVSTSVNLELETVEIPEIKSESKSQKGGEEAPQKLPGFDLNPVHDEPEVSSKSNKSSRFSQQATINKVEVYLILDESIDEKNQCVKLMMNLGVTCLDASKQRELEQKTRNISGY